MGLESTAKVYTSLPVGWAKDVSNRKRILDLVDLLHRLMMGGAIHQEDLENISTLSYFDLEEIEKHDPLVSMTVDCLSYMIRRLVDGWEDDEYNEATLRAMYRIALGINEEILSIRHRF